MDEHVYGRYRDVTGEYVDGRFATIGMQSFGAKWTYSYCESERGRLYDGLALDFHLGMNSNPNDGDTDGDGLSDSQEVALGTNLNSSDTDGDGMPDGWEQRHSGNGFDPNVDNSTDANPNNDRDADPDGDGLTNGREAEVGTNPGVSDTDGDGIADGVADLSVSVTIRAMNVRDGRLPSSVIVGMFPLNVVQANMPTSTGVAGTTDAGTAYVRENIPSNVYLQKWFHSDMKDMAYFYVYPLYDELKTKGNLK